MGPPFVLIEGEGSHQGKVGFTPLYPGVNPTPHWLPVPHWGELKFPRVINPDSPLNDSRQLECSGQNELNDCLTLNVFSKCYCHCHELR